jgi:hypothetical protein
VPHEAPRYRLSEDDQPEEGHADREQRQADWRVPFETDQERESGRDKRQEGQHSRPPFEEPARPPAGAVGSIVRGDDDARPAPGLNRKEQKPDREGERQAAQSIFADPADEIAFLRHEKEDRRDADGEGGDDWCARRAIVDVDDTAPSGGEAAEGGGQPPRAAAGGGGEAHRATIVGITIQPIVGEGDRLARSREGFGASGADRKSCRVRLVPELAHELEPRLARDARRETKSIVKEVAIAGGTATDNSGAPLADRRKSPSFSGRDGPDGNLEHVSRHIDHHCERRSPKLLSFQGSGCELAVGMLRADPNELVLPRFQSSWMLDEPCLGAGELQPGQKRVGFVLVRRRLPVAQILLELLLANQELPFRIEPGPQQRPFAKQRLVRRFNHARRRPAARSRVSRSPIASAAGGI